jgi:hypothetical protein
MTQDRPNDGEKRPGKAAKKDERTLWGKKATRAGTRRDGGTVFAKPERVKIYKRPRGDINDESYRT